MKKWYPLVAICLGSFVFLVDTTIVTIAIPNASASLSTSLTGLEWVMNIYTLVLAVLMIPAGWVSDHFEHRNVFRIGLILFAAASLACGLSPNIDALIVARGLQGIGGAAIAVTTFALLGTSYEGQDRMTAISIWAAINGLGAATGPMLGGVLTEFFSWRAIFFLNVPLVVVTYLFTRMNIAPSEQKVPSTSRFDIAGVLTFAITASCTTLFFTLIQQNGWSGETWLLLGLALAALTAFILREQRTAFPIIDLKLFSNTQFSATMFGVMASASVFSALVFTSIWLQANLGLNAIHAGLAISPLAVATFIVSVFFGKRLPNVSPMRKMGAGLLLCGVGTLLQAHLRTTSGPLSLTAGLLVTGIGLGISIPSMGAAVMSVTPPNQRGAVAGLMTTFRQLGQTLGVALLGMLFAHKSTNAGHIAAHLDHLYIASAIVTFLAGVMILRSKATIGTPKT